MRRAGLSRAAIDGLRMAFRILYRETPVLSAALERIESEVGMISEVAEFLTFIRESKTGVNPMRSWERANISM
jgi:UDP-N-acetylglucosamine acyltransferase